MTNLRPALLVLIVAIWASPVAAQYIAAGSNYDLTRPRKEQVAILAALRSMGKRETQARLKQLTKQRTRKKK